MTVRIRPARPEDYPCFVRWFPMLDSGDRTPTLETWTESLVAETSIAELNGAPAGYCRGQVFGTEGYVRHLVVEPALRRSGAGRALLDAAAASMRNAGCTRWRLNVKPDNTAAVALYESLGMEILHMCASVRFEWTLLDVLPQPSGMLSVVDPSAEQQRALESTYGLPMGQLATAESRADVHVRAVQGDALQGVALFDTQHRGAFPFRADSIDAAMSLLHGLRSLAAASAMAIVVEADDALDRVMVDAGARVHFRFAHMRGPL